MTRKNIIIALVIVALAGAGFWYAFSFSGGQNPLSGKKAVARVNGEKITNAEFQTQLEETKKMASKRGLDIEEEKLKTQVLDQMINTALIKQKAKQEGVTVEQSEVDAEIDKVIETLGGEEAFDKQLKGLDLTKKELREMAKEELLVQKYAESQISDEEMAVSDEEAKSYFDQMMAQQGAENATNTPTFEEMEEAQKDQIKSQLQQQKQSNKMQEVIDQLRKEAEIEKLL